jgi:phosphoribosylformimino-5-aminoimidazole carboxamide ribotide isomerase
MPTPREISGDKSTPQHLFRKPIRSGKMTKFRPCIDLHSGQVKQIVGGTLSNVAADLKTNYVSKLPASHYAELYQKHDIHGGHVVMLGPGNDAAAKEALSVWPGGLQIAGGINDKNAQYWIDQGAEKVSSMALLNVNTL